MDWAAVSFDEIKSLQLSSSGIEGMPNVARIETEDDIGMEHQGISGAKGTETLVQSCYHVLLTGPVARPA